jgi:hypothetical protein
MSASLAMLLRPEAHTSQRGQLTPFIPGRGTCDGSTILVGAAHIHSQNAWSVH